MANKKMCPLMSSNAVACDDGSVDNLVPCIEHACRLWIEVYTTEGEPVNGCAKEFEPGMRDGVLVV